MIESQTLSERFEQHQYQGHEEVEEIVEEACSDVLDDIEWVSVVDCYTLHDADYVEFVGDVFANTDRDWYMNKLADPILTQLREELGLVPNAVMELSDGNYGPFRFRVWFDHYPIFEEDQ